MPDRVTIYPGQKTWIDFGPAINAATGDLNNDLTLTGTVHKKNAARTEIVDSEFSLDPSGADDGMYGGDIPGDVVPETVDGIMNGRAYWLHIVDADGNVNIWRDAIGDHNEG